MVLETALLGAGLISGYYLGGRAHDEWHARSGDKSRDEWHGGAAREGGKLPQRSSDVEAVAGPQAAEERYRRVDETMTVMLAGDSGSGKTLFCSRVALAGSSEALGRETLPRTVAPVWQRVDATVTLEGSPKRVSFQFLDTPGRSELAELLVPFYRQAHAVVLLFDVGSAASFERMQTAWYAAVQQHRLELGSYPAGSTVVLAHVIDERRERQVTRREASAWCQSVGCTYFETHAKDSTSWRRMLSHLARACLADAGEKPAAGSA